MTIPTKHTIKLTQPDGSTEEITLGKLANILGYGRATFFRNMRVNNEDAQQTAIRYTQQELDRMNENRPYNIPDGFPEASHKAVLADFAKKLGLEVPDTPEDGSTEPTEDAAKTYANKTYSFPESGE